MKSTLTCAQTQSASSVQSIAQEQEVSSYPVHSHAFVHCFIPDIIQDNNSDWTSRIFRKINIREKKLQFLPSKSRQAFLVISADISDAGVYIRYQWFFIVYGLTGFLKAEESYGSSQENEQMNVQTIFEYSLRELREPPLKLRLRTRVSHRCFTH